MAEPTLEEWLADNHDAIRVGAQGRMRGDPTMRRVAEQRELSENEMVSQVLGFWLQAVRTDIALGSTAALAQNMQWLVSLRAGHNLPFDDSMVLRMFEDLSTEIDTRLDSDAMRNEYSAYRKQVVQLITDAFPE